MRFSPGMGWTSLSPMGSFWHATNRQSASSPAKNEKQDLFLIII
jgi:hypothetical protein